MIATSVTVDLAGIAVAASGGATPPTRLVDLCQIIRQIETANPRLTEVQAGRSLLDPTEFENWLGRHQTLASTEFLGTRLIHPDRVEHILRERASNENRAQQLLADDLLKAAKWAFILSNPDTLAAGTRRFQGLIEVAEPARVAGAERFGGVPVLVDELEKLAPAPSITSAPVVIPPDLQSSLAGVIDERGFFRLCLKGKDGTPVEVESNYCVVDIVGKGGMGVVLKAHQLDPDTLQVIRPVAIKVVLGDDPGLQERLTQEGRAHKKLGQGKPHILTVYDTGKTPEGHTCIFMQLADGSVHSLLDNGKFGNWENRTRLYAEFLRGLEYAHEEGILHRDMKPENIFFTTEAKTGQVMTPQNTQWLAGDWGIYLEVAEAERERQSKNVIGSGGYMAPEVTLRQEYSKQGDGFAIAATHYKLLTGQHPMETAKKSLWDQFGDFLPFASSEWAPQHGTLSPIKTPSELNHEIPVELSEIIMRGLDADPNYRQADAGAYRHDLEAFFEKQRAMVPWRASLELIASAEAAKGRGEKETWATEARKAFDKFLEALEIHRDREWLRWGIETFITQMGYAEEIGDEILLAQIRHDFAQFMRGSVRSGGEPIADFGYDALRDLLSPEIAAVFGAEFVGVDETSITTLRFATRLGAIHVHIEGLPEGIGHYRRVHRLRNTNGRLVPGEVVLDDVGTHEPLRLDRGNYTIDVWAPGYHPQRHTVFLQRAGEAELHYQMVRTEDVPKGFVPIPPGYIYVRRKKHNIPGEKPVWVDGFLAAKDPLAFGDYARFLIKYAWKKVEEQGVSDESVSRAIDEAMVFDLVYERGRPVWKNTKELLTTALHHFRRLKSARTELTIDLFMEHFFAKPEVKNHFVYTVGEDPIQFGAPVTLIDEGQIETIIASAYPGLRRLSWQEGLRLIFGGDGRLEPWGDSEAEPGYLNANLGRWDVDPTTGVLVVHTPDLLEIGNTSEGPANYRDISPLSPLLPDLSEITAVRSVTETRVFSSGSVGRSTATIGPGWNVTRHSPNSIGFAPLDGRHAHIGLRLARNLP